MEVARIVTSSVRLSHSGLPPQVMPCSAVAWVTQREAAKTRAASIAG